MNIVRNPNQFDIRNTYFTDSLYNATTNSGFIRIVMCEPAMNTAGLHLRLQLSGATISRRYQTQLPATAATATATNNSAVPVSPVIQYCTDYNTEKNFALIASIRQIEQDILRLYRHTFKPANKEPCSHIFDTLLCNRLKICANIGASSVPTDAAKFGNPPRFGTDKPVEQNDDADDFTCDAVHEQTVPIVLKISGVWESEATFGLTFKFIIVSDV